MGKSRRKKYALPVALYVGREEQPVNKVTWVHRSMLHCNNYNPNHVAPIEMELLKISILEDGWTQPIVVTGNEITDGFHRWLCSDIPEIYAMTEGFVPVVYRKDNGIAKQKQATVRHNRAGGTHGVLEMATLVQTLIDEDGMTPDQVMQELMMDEEECERLYDKGGMTMRAGKTEFNKGWVPE